MKKRLLFTFLIQLCYAGAYAQEPALFSSFNYNLADPRDGDAISSWAPNTCQYRESPRYDDKRLADSFACIINLHPDCRYELQVHSDCRADAVYNSALTIRQAEWWAALISPQIPAYVNIQYIGKGESEPVNNCKCEGSYISKRCTEEEHDENRRLVLIVTD